MKQVGQVPCPYVQIVKGKGKDNRELAQVRVCVPAISVGKRCSTNALSVCRLAQTFNSSTTFLRTSLASHLLDSGRSTSLRFPESYDGPVRLKSGGPAASPSLTRSTVRILATDKDLVNEVHNEAQGA